MRSKWVSKKFIYRSTKDNPRYDLLLNDVRWIAKRNVILQRDNRQCINCKSSNNLVIHHRQYIFIKRINNFVLPWEYPNESLITLCIQCHYQGHKHFKVPILYK